MKFVAVAVLALALQALCVSGYVANSRDLNALDVADKADQDLVVSPQLGLGAQRSSSGGFTGVLKRLQGILEGIRRQIEKAGTNITNAVTTLVADGVKLAESTITGWNQSIQDLIDGTEARNKKIEECKAEQPSLDSVTEELNADIQACAQNASATATASLKELEVLSTEVEDLINQTNKYVEECAGQGLILQGLCVASHAPELAIQGGLLAANAGRLSAQVAVELAVRAPAQSAVCVAAAVADRAAEAATIIEGIRECVNADVSTTPTIPEEPTTEPEVEPTSVAPQ